MSQENKWEDNTIWNDVNKWLEERLVVPNWVFYVAIGVILTTAIIVANLLK